MYQDVLPRPAWDLIELIRCALHGKTISDQAAGEMDMEALLLLAQAQSLASMASFALPGQPEPWIEEQEKSLRKNLLLDMERRKLCRWMEQNGIWHMSLKGSVLKELYPRMEMRQMSDQDILYDRAYQKKLHRYMLEQGYQTEGVQDSHHDAYYKLPLYAIELHHTLFDRACDLKLVDYYRDVKQRLIPDAPGSCAYHFSDEDFYIYMTAHAFKHYRNKGIGIRALVDVWVYEKAKPLDWAYVERECARLGIGDYERACRMLARKLFCGDRIGELTQQELDMLRFCFEAGTHGTEDAGIRQKLKTMQGGAGAVTGQTRFRYFWSRVFPSVQWMKQQSKMVRKHPWTLPLAWCIRLCRGIFISGGQTVREIRYVMDTEKL